MEITTTTTCTHSLTGVTHDQIRLIWALLSHVRLGESDLQLAALDLIGAMEDHDELLDLVQNSGVEVHVRLGEDGPVTHDFVIEVCDDDANTQWAWTPWPL